MKKCASNACNRIARRGGDCCRGNCCETLDLDEASALWARIEELAKAVDATNKASGIRKALTDDEKTQIEDDYLRGRSEKVHSDIWAQPHKGTIVSGPDPILQELREIKGFVKKLVEPEKQDPSEGKMDCCRCEKSIELGSLHDYVAEGARCFRCQNVDALLYAVRGYVDGSKTMSSVKQALKPFEGVG